MTDIINRSGISYNIGDVSTDFSPKVSDVDTLSVGDGGVLKDFTDSFKRYGGMESVTGAINFLTKPTSTPGFNVYRSSQIKDLDHQFLLDHTGEFEGIRSEEELTIKLDSLKKEQEFNAQYEDRDLWNIPAITGAVAGMALDPTNILPLASIRKLGKGISLIATSAAFAGSTAIRDSLSDSTLSDDQKVYNAAFAGAVGLAFSGAAIGAKWAQAKYSTDQTESLVKEEIVRQKYVDENNNFIKVDNDSVKVHETLDEYLDAGKPELKIADPEGGLTGKFFKFRLSNIEGNLMPKFRLLNSPIKSMAWAAHTLTGTSLKMNRAAGNGIEGLVHTQVDNLTIPVFQKSEQIYTKFLKDNPGTKVSLTEFETGFHKGVEYGTWGDSILTKYYDELLPHYKKPHDTTWNQAKVAGIVDKDAVSSRNYVSRSYNYDKIAKDSVGFKTILPKAIISGTKKEISSLKTRLKELDEGSEGYMALSKKLSKLEKRINSKNYAEDAAEYYYDAKIVGTPTTAVRLGKSKAEAKSFNERELFIDHALLNDYLDTDFRRSLVRSMKEQVVDIAVTTHYGDSKFTKLMDVVKSEVAELSAKNPEKASEYVKIAEENLIDFFGGINRLRGFAPDGTIKNDFGHQAVNWLTTATTTGLMGASATSNVPEAFTVVKSMVSLQKETVDAFKKIVGTDVTKLSKIEKQRLGFAVQNALQETRLNSLDSVSGSLSKIDELPNKIKSAAYISFGQTFVTNLLESLKAGHISDIISKVAVAGSSAAKKDLDYVLSLGFRKGDLPKIAEQFKKYAVKTEDGTLTNAISNWEGNIGIRMRTIVHDEVRKNVISKDVLTTPLWFDNSALGKAFGQFKGFMFGAMEKYALTDLQKGGSHFATMLVVRSVGGMFAYLLRSSLLRNWEDVDVDPKTLFHEGLMRGGGIIGMDFLSDIADMYGLGIGRMLGTNRAMRRKSAYGNDPALRTLAGAPATVIGDITKTVTNISQGNFDPEAYKHLMKYPFGHFVTQGIINRVFE